MNQKQLAEACSVSPSAVCQWEDGDEHKRTKPTTGNLEKIALACGCGLYDLLSSLPPTADESPTAA